MSPELIETPCINVCVIDPLSRYCIGCGRTAHEISIWSELSVIKRRELMSSLAPRLASLSDKGRRRGGRARQSKPPA